MPAVGPTSFVSGVASSDRDLLTSYTSALTIAAADVLMSTVFLCGFARRVYCNAAGTLYVKRLSDTAFVPYTMAAGAYLDGKILAIGGTTTGSTAMTINLEL